MRLQLIGDQGFQLRVTFQQLLECAGLARRTGSDALCRAPVRLDMFVGNECAQALQTAVGMRLQAAFVHAAHGAERHPGGGLDGAQGSAPTIQPHRFFTGAKDFLLLSRESGPRHGRPQCRIGPIRGGGATTASHVDALRKPIAGPNGRSRNAFALMRPLCSSMNTAVRTSTVSCGWKSRSSCPSVGALDTACSTSSNNLSLTKRSFDARYGRMRSQFSIQTP